LSSLSFGLPTTTRLKPTQIWIFPHASSYHARLMGIGLAIVPISIVVVFL
jgi:hypothetical protein